MPQPLPRPITVPALPRTSPKLPKYTPPRPSVVSNFLNSTSWMISDPVRFHALMKEAASLVSGGVYLGDNLFTWGRNNSFIDDVEFRRAWESNIVNSADEVIAWRR